MPMRLGWQLLLAPPLREILARGATSIVLGKEALAQSNRLGGHFHQLVGADEFDGRLQRDGARRRQADRLVVRVGPHVGQLLLAAGVDVHVLGSRVLADDHAFVYGLAGTDQKLGSLLEAVERVAVRVSLAVRDENAGGAMRDFTGPRAVALGDLVQQRRPARVREELAAEADEAADRDDVFHAHATVRVGAHLLEAALAVRESALHGADEVRRDVHCDALVRLLRLAVDGLQDDLRAADLQLKTLAAHLLNQDRQLEFASAQNLVRVCRVRLLELDRHVAEDFLFQAVADVASGDVLAFAARQRRRVRAEGHAQCGIVQVQPLHRARIRGIRDGVADGDVRNAGQGHDVARARFVDVHALDAVRGGEARDRATESHRAPGNDRTVGRLFLFAEDDYLLPELDSAVPDAPDRHSADVFIGREV